MGTGESKLRNLLNSNRFFSTVLLSIFFVLGVIGLRHHAMWRDEVYAWLLARASGTLHELYLRWRFEAHFMLWDVLVWCLTRFSQHCEALQWFHLVLATIGVWVVLRFGPFTRVEKVLYCFGYFTLFEYCLVCREYVCIVVLVFGLCALYDRRKDDFIAQAVVVFLLSNIDVLATMIAFAFVAARVVEQVHLGRMGELWAARKRGLIIGGVVLVLALLSDGVQLMTLQRSLASTGRSISIRVPDIEGALTSVWRGYVPIPMPFPHYFDVWRGSGTVPTVANSAEKFFWGTNFLLDGELVSTELGVVLSLGLLAGSAWTLRRSRMAVTWYLAGASMLLVFQAVIGSGALRHHGLHFILYLACVWCAGSSGGDSSGETVAVRRPGSGEWLFLTSLLVVQVVAGVYVWTILLQAPFSSSKTVADYIRQHGYGELPVIGSREEQVSSVTAYLGRSIYYPDSARYGTYPLESGIRRELSTEELCKQVFEFTELKHGDTLFLFTGGLGLGGERLRSGWLLPDGELSRLSAPMGAWLRISFLGEFRGSVDEEYSLYLVQRP